MHESLLPLASLYHSWIGLTRAAWGFLVGAFVVLWCRLVMAAYPSDAPRWISPVRRCQQCLASLAGMDPDKIRR